MKIVFYRNLLQVRDYLKTPNEKIVYSFLLSKAMFYNDFFDADGQSLMMDDVRECLNEYNYLGMYSYSVRRIASELNLSPTTVSSVIEKLKFDNIIKNDEIYVNFHIIKKGFFSLECPHGIKGELRIFYSFLKDKASQYNGSIDTFKYKLAEKYNTTETAVTKLLNRLYELKLAKRLPNGKLEIY